MTGISVPRRLRRDNLADSRGFMPVQDCRAASGAASDRPPSLVARVVIFPIRVYQRFISPALPPACRFTPTCSQYAVEALRRHGALKGSWLAMRRIARCHPWHPGGEDPVP